MNDRSYHDFDTARPLLNCSGMRIRMTALYRTAGLLAMAGLCACGQVNFGSSLLPEDTGPAPDADAGVVVVIDTGVDTGVDSGPPVDAGCIPVTLPTALPDEWPFPDDRETFQALFLDWAQDPASQCTICHALDTINAPPLIIAANQGGRLEDSRNQVWDDMKSSSLKSSDLIGPLWRHIPDHPDYDPSKTFSADDIAFLEGFMTQAWGCQVPDFLASQDAGAGCRGAGEDAGSDPNSGLCYCDDQPDPGPIDISLCTQ
ncbi:MAG: hypothetical protein AAFV29_09120 [Myxococcota bacterium]